MSYWAWIFVGVGSFLVLSLLVVWRWLRSGRRNGRSVSDLYETEEWALTPPSRALHAEPEEAKQPHRVIRLR